MESILKTEASPYRTTLVALESVYSMGEGAAPVADIVLTAKKYGALVLVDEAHSFIAAALAALRRLSADDALRERLWDTTTYMRRRFSEAGYDLGTGDGPIVTPHFSDRDKLYAIAHGLYKRGVHTAAVTYPIVESGRGRLRFICSASHTREDVDRTLEALIDAEREAEEERRVLEDRASAHPGRFIWLIARMADWQRDSIGIDSDAGSGPV